ncbi:hypothetical protein PANDA_011435 [Ailuropoda melanoleuca]|uniref:Placenta-specific protein 9 n=1 Tax=Ailuropoda melanoleuca TaxID=9646 RepID=D2HJF6_AILME|nr:hypothetical protein PANDA_011435 [Ailuropoda melanoleuca]
MLKGCCEDRGISFYKNGYCGSEPLKDNSIQGRSNIPWQFRDIFKCMTALDQQSNLAKQTCQGRSPTLCGRAKGTVSNPGEFRQHLLEEAHLGMEVTTAIDARVSGVIGNGDKARFPTAAEPSVSSRGDPTWNAGCDRYMAVHDRLDVIEETVEKTVEHLEAEVKGLLGQLEELAWSLPPGPLGPIPDLFGDDGFGAPEPALPSSWK